MALVARPALQAPVATTAAARAVHSHGNVASYDGSQIEELSPSAMVAFDQDTFLLPEDFNRHARDQQRAANDLYRDGGRERGRGAVPSRTTNETFAALFQLTEFKGTEVEPKPHVKGPRGFGGLLTKAVNTYEHNSKVIHGEIVPRGRQVRLAV